MGTFSLNYYIRKSSSDVNRLGTVTIYCQFLKPGKFTPAGLFLASSTSGRPGAGFLPEVVIQ